MDNLLHVLVIIDSSDSMSTKKYSVLTGFNEYVKQLRKDTGHNYLLSAVTFNNRVYTLFQDMALSQVDNLNAENYRPFGSTALYDAIGLSIIRLTSKIKKFRKPYGKERILVVIITDGMNNSSNQYSKGEIQSMIRARKEAGNWTFVYLGEDQNAWAVASELGFDKGNVIEYQADETLDIFQRLAISTKTYSADNSSITTNFIEEIDVEIGDPDKLP